LSRHPKVVPIGEIGIDYYYERSTRDYQQEVFAGKWRSRCAGICRSSFIPETDADAVRIVTELSQHSRMKRTSAEGKGFSHPGFFHCIAGDAATARELIEE